MTNGFIINRGKSEVHGKEVSIYMIQHENGVEKSGKVKYLNPRNREVKNYTEPELIEYLKVNNITLHNAKVENNKIVARDASLTRFEQAGYARSVKPYTVCAEIRSDKGVLLGYRVASARSGDVKPVTVDDFIQACESLIVTSLKASNNPRELFKPVQNMKFSPNMARLRELASNISVAMVKLLDDVCAKSGMNVQDDKDSFLSIYSVSNPLPVETWVVKSNQYSSVPKVAESDIENAKKVEKKATDISKLFTKEQLEALAWAKSKGVDIKNIANPELPAKRMRAIAALEADGFNGFQLKDPKWPDTEFNYLAANIRLGVDVSEVLNPAYNTRQMAVILAGIMEGLDVNEYANPSLTFELMSQKHRDMVDKSGWCKDLKILEGTKYTF